MHVKLVSATLVSARDLNDGEIAVLEDSAACFDSYRGDVVQRHNDKLVILGKPSDHWFHIDCSHRFRVLRPGETLMITENQPQCKEPPTALGSSFPLSTSY